MVDWKQVRTATILHELGHGLNLAHWGHGSRDIMFSQGGNTAGDIRTELNSVDASTYDGVP